MSSASFITVHGADVVLGTRNAAFHPGTAVWLRRSPLGFILLGTIGANWAIFLKCLLKRTEHALLFTVVYIVNILYNIVNELVIYRFDTIAMSYVLHI